MRAAVILMLGGVLAAGPLARDAQAALLAYNFTYTQTAVSVFTGGTGTGGTDGSDFPGLVPDPRHQSSGRAYHPPRPTDQPDSGGLALADSAAGESFSALSITWARMLA